METTTDRHAPWSRLVAAGCLAGSAGIHLDLYLTGYRHIPTIGPLFLLQFASGLVLAALLIGIDRTLVRVAAAGFALSTIAGYTLSRFVGLFGFNERPSASGLAAGLLELGAFAALVISAAGPARRVAPTIGNRVGTVSARPLVGAVAIAALLGVVLAAGIGSSTPAPGAPATSPATHGAVVHVVIANFAFSPAHVFALPGQTVSVRNEDSVDHTLTAMPGTAADFDTGDIAPGHTREFAAPRRAGTYPFFCEIHNFMTGELTVRG